MKVVVQRVSEASVSVEKNELASIKQGLLLLVGIQKGDTNEQMEKMASKIAKMRIFEDNDEKMNLSVTDVGGSILSVSQFTLLANTTKGNRPSFVEAAAPDEAIPLYNYFNQQLEQNNLPVSTGQFGAHMMISLINDGPVTICLEN